MTSETKTSQAPILPLLSARQSLRAAPRSRMPRNGRNLRVVIESVHDRKWEGLAGLLIHTGIQCSARTSNEEASKSGTGHGVMAKILRHLGILFREHNPLDTSKRAGQHEYQLQGLSKEARSHRRL